MYIYIYINIYKKHILENTVNSRLNISVFTKNNPKQLNVKVISLEKLREDEEMLQLDYYS